MLKDYYFTSKSIKIVSMFLVKREHRKPKDADIKKLYEALKKKENHLAKFFLSLNNFAEIISHNLPLQDYSKVVTSCHR